MGTGCVLVDLCSQRSNTGISKLFLERAIEEVVQAMGAILSVSTTVLCP